MTLPRLCTLPRPLRWALDGALLVLLGFVLFLGYGTLPNGFYRVMVVTSGSMRPAFQPGDVIIVTPRPAQVTPGMVVVLGRGDQLVTHRVTQVLADGTFRTKGDANPVEDPADATLDQVFGQVAGSLPVPGIGTLVSIRSGTAAAFHTRWTAEQRFTIGHWETRQAQAIEFPALDDRTVDDAAAPLAARATSGLAVVYVADGPCTIDGDRAVIGGPGTCSVTARQPGDDRWLPAEPVTRSFQVTRLDAHLRFALDGLGTVRVGDLPFSVAPFATSDSSAPVAFRLGAGSSGCSVTADGLVTIDGPAIGDAACIIEASVDGDDRHRADGPIARSFSIQPVEPQAQSIAFPAPADRTYGDPPFDPGAVASSGLPVALAADGPCRVEDGRVRLTGAGRCTVTAEQPGDASWAAADPVTRSVTIAPARLVIHAPQLAIVLGEPVPELRPGYTGFVGSDGPGVLSERPTCTVQGDPQTVGTHPVTCSEPTAPDYRIVLEPGSLVVRFAAPGACLAGPGHRILQPVNADGSSVFRSGSTVVLKLRVCDAAGRSIGAAGTIAELRRTATVEGTAVRAVNETVVRALPDRAFRWNPIEQLWVMNLDTCGLRSRHTHSYLVTLADGSTISFRFGLR